MSSSIFRPEVFRERHASVFGTVVVSTPVRFSVLMSGALGIAVAVMLFLSLGTYSRKSQVTGYLTPDKGIVQVFSPASGIIQSALSRNGQRVRAGDPLYEVNLERSSSEHAETQAAMLEQLVVQRDSLDRERDQIAELATVTQQAVEKRIRLTKSEIAQLAEVVKTREERIATSSDTLQRYQDLGKKGFVSELEIARQRNDWLGEKSTAQALQRDHIALERDLQALRDQASTEQLTAQGKQEQIDRERAGISQKIAELEASRSLIVRAPVEGVVTSVVALLGQHVEATAPLLTIMPRDAVLEAHLTVPTRAVGFVKLGDKVLLRYQAFPYERYGHQTGIVSDIGRTVLFPSEALGRDSQEAAYLVTVTLAKQTITTSATETPLQAGMLLDADVLLDERPIYQWALEPLYSVAGRL